MEIHVFRDTNAGFRLWTVPMPQGSSGGMALQQLLNSIAPVGDPDRIAMDMEQDRFEYLDTVSSTEVDSIGE